MAGLHFFYPVALKNIVEIIRMPETSQGTLGKIGAFLKTIHRDPILLDESNSFILNRIYLEFQNEGFLLVNAKEATISRVDRIVRDHFFPQGLFEFFDSVGLDVMLASIKNYTMDDPGRARYQPLILHLEKLVSEEKLGNKTGTGFYQGGVNDEPGDHNGDEALILKLRESYATAFRKFSASSGIPPAALKLLMDEYFGCDSPFII
jgi:3-hydroxyacyl-CoA dehydrogenase